MQSPSGPALRRASYQRHPLLTEIAPRRPPEPQIGPGRRIQPMHGDGAPLRSGGPVRPRHVPAYETFRYGSIICTRRMSGRVCQSETGDRASEEKAGK